MNPPATKTLIPKAIKWSWRALLFLIAVGLVTAITIQWSRWEGRPGWRRSDDAYLQADQTPISARVAGYLRDVPVQDYQRVKAGTLLAEIVDDDYRAATAQAEAGVAAAMAQADALAAQRPLLEANARAARAAADATAANLDQNGRDLTRQGQLQASGSSTPEAAEKLHTTGDQLSAQLRQGRAQADAAARQLGVLTAQQEQARAAIAAAEATLQTARINLGYTKIVAPRDGVVGLRQVRPGQYLPVAIGSFQEACSMSKSGGKKAGMQCSRR